MRVECIPLTSFVHGDIRAVQDKRIEIESSLASELERRGLVRVKVIPRRVDKAIALGAAAEVVPGNMPAGGQGQPLSASPPAPVSPLTTLHLPKRGRGRPRKNAA